MAIYHFQMKTVSRSQGRSATAAAAYRSGERIEDERTGLVHDYSKRSGVLMAEVVLPDGGTVEREALWNAAEGAEKRCNSVVAREFVVALPHELNPEQQQKLVLGYAQGLSERTGWAVDVAVHAPGKEGDIRNVHAHLLCTTRKIDTDPDGCPVMQQKTREWDQRSTGSELLRLERSEWECCVNQSLEQANCIKRVDCRSHAEKHSGLTPQIHLGPNVMGMERRGIETQRGDEYREIEAHNAKVLSLSELREQREQEQAFQADLEAMKSMPFARLEAMRAQYEPPSIAALADEYPLVKPEKEKYDSHRLEQRRLEIELERVHNEQRDSRNQATAYRESHPWQARLHDLKVVSSKTLSTLEERDEQLRGNKLDIEASMVVSRVANMQSMQRLELLRAKAYPDAAEEYRNQSMRYREVTAIYDPRKEAYDREQEAIVRSQREVDRTRWERMSVKDLESEAQAYAVHDPRAVAFEYSSVKQAYEPFREAEYRDDDYKKFLNKEFGQYHERWKNELLEEKKRAERSLKHIQERESDWIKKHPFKNLAYKTYLPSREAAAIVRDREAAQERLAVAEKALSEFSNGRRIAHIKLEDAIEKVLPEAQKEASSRQERYLAIQQVLQPKQALERQQREQALELERQKRGKNEAGIPGAIGAGKLGFCNSKSYTYTK